MSLGFTLPQPAKESAAAEVPEEVDGHGSRRELLVHFLDHGGLEEEQQVGARAWHEPGAIHGSGI